MLDLERIIVESNAWTRKLNPLHEHIIDVVIKILTPIRKSIFAQTHIR